MGPLSSWVEGWRETYEAYPAATALNLAELSLAGVLLLAALLYPAFARRLPWQVGLVLVALGAGFVVWFTVLRASVLDRLV
ncbi:hypothetical protein BRD18_07460 [Halobacteriales archaeon SW_7_71_33]|nr:MAG: hypothetical protein BRD18_07460 [Halobacteriales archaeon SW_7_71_33]